MNFLLRLIQKPSADSLVKEHGPRVYKQLRRIFGPQSDIDDVFQAVFVEVVRSLPSFAGKAKLSTWIRRITWNVAYHEMRLNYRRGPVREAADDVLPSGDCSPEDQLVLDRLYAALAELDPKLRMVVTLHDLEGCTLKEVGENLGRPLQTVASQLNAGRAELARALNDKGKPLQQDPGATAWTGNVVALRPRKPKGGV